MGADTATSGFMTDILRPLNNIRSGQSNMFAASVLNAPTNCSNGMDKVACPSVNGGIEATANRRRCIKGINMT